MLVDNGTAAFSASSSFARYTRSPVRVGRRLHGGRAFATAGTATWEAPGHPQRQLPTVGPLRPPDENRNTRASYRVYTDATEDSGQTPMTVNQRQPGTQGWVQPGSTSLNPGAKVVLSAASSLRRLDHRRRRATASPRPEPPVPPPPLQRLTIALGVPRAAMQGPRPPP
ncbi:MAG: hypothetical protein IPF99_07310 [Deltaproteobacteria bacterium]|nr:hypothetical protein [Deltaproteobacteria bacterium]